MSNPGTSLVQHSGIINENVAVRITNLDERRHRFGYANQEYHLAPAGQPGSEVIAPYLAACLWFGDPRAINVGEKSKRSTQHRDREIERLSVRYGMLDDAFYTEFDDEVRETSHIPINSELGTFIAPKPYIGGRHPNLPRVAVTDLATGDRILTVIDDPAGDNLIAPTNEQVEQKALAQQVAEMGEALKRMQLELASKDPQAAADLAAQGVVPMVPTGVDTDAIASALSDVAVGDPQPDPDDPASRPSPDTGTPSVPRTKPTKGAD